MSNRSAFVRGAVAGALAATVVAVFFFLVDAFEGRVFETPRYLAGILLDREEGGGVAGLLLIFTVVHYIVFMTVGVAVAWLLDRSGIPPALPLGLVVGFLLFDAVFYTGVAVRGVNVAQSLGWPAFLAGNLLAGLVMLAWLGRTAERRPRGLRDALREHRTIREGIVAGLLGAAAVALLFFLYDLALGRLFFMPAALGSALLFGADDPALVQVTAATVLGFSIVHLVAFLAVGLGFAALVVQADRHPPVLLALGLLFVTFETLAIGLIALVASWLLDVVPWWTIALANVVAAVVMGGYLWKRHPTLAQGMERAEQPVPEPHV